VSSSAADFESKLATLLAQRVTGFDHLVAAERLSGGASQETYRLVAATDGGERRLAMRRAPGGSEAERAPGHPGLATEARLMQCAREAGIPEPEVVHVLEPSDGLGDGFLMQWLEGETLGPRIVRSEELAAVRPRLARQCGEILARIHAIDLEATGLDRLLDPMTPLQFVEQTWSRYKALPVCQPMIDFVGRWLLEHLPDCDELTLVHNDFRNGNLMVGPEGVIAVLDWEIAHIGDPMRDLGWICTNSWRFGGEPPVGGFGSYDELFAGYEAVSGRPVDREHVKFWEVFGSFWWAVGCLGMAEHYRSGPDQSVERPAIGRRTAECQVDCVNLLIPGPVELIAAEPFESTLDMPRIDELVESVRDYLREEVMAETGGRTRFLARVAGNSLDIVLRELALGGPARAAELDRLEHLLGSGGKLEALRAELVARLRDGTLALDAEGLADHLRATVVQQAAIDQPRYSGFRTASHRGGDA
jgi:aminoglycoside phosphotransferase (APT) family kinase protein